jgi:hypothetical protein
LLDDSKNDVNPYADYKPSVPSGEKVVMNSTEFDALEKKGVDQLQYTGMFDNHNLKVSFL